MDYSSSWILIVAIRVGAVLSQEQNGRERIIAFMSKAMNKHEQLYCTTRKELLAAVYTLRTFRFYFTQSSLERITLLSAGFIN